MNRKQRIKNRTTALKLHFSLPPKSICPNCLQKTHNAHFVPPVFGGEGYFLCLAPGQRGRDV